MSADPAAEARRYATALRRLADRADDYADQPDDERWAALVAAQRDWGRNVEALMRARMRHPLIPVLLPTMPGRSV